MKYYSEEDMENLRIRFEAKVLLWPQVSTKNRVGSVACTELKALVRYPNGWLFLQPDRRLTKIGWDIIIPTSRYKIKMRKAQAYSPTKEKLLEAAQQLMLAKGFAATTVDEICEAAGFTKGSFFHYFTSKEQLGKAVLDRFFLAMVQKVQKGSFHGKSDPLQHIYDYVDCFSDLTKDPLLANGCLLGNFAQELSDTHPEIRSLCAQRFSQWAEALKRDLDEAKTRYAPKAPFDTRSLAEHFIAVLEGSLILAKAKQDMTIFEKNLWHFKRYLRSLFGR